ncbi:TrbC/VirB2 family protein [Patescibacteria group bacterium]|nr:TrbC/VirB2 family protein [Patescibacteria group bacterium]
MIPTINNATLRASAFAFCLTAGSPVAFADLFGEIPAIGGSDDIETTITDLVIKILSLMALIAVVVIVIAGVRLVISQGEQEAVEKSKKTILYAVVGLIIILLAQAIVQFIADFAT